MKNNIKTEILFFGNIFVNDEEKFIHMRDSFESIFDENLFSTAIINVRGKLAKKSLNYLKSKKIDNLYSINSPYGWYHDTYNITKNSKFDYIFCWLEDFICTNKSLFKNMLFSLKKNKIDIIKYYPTKLDFKINKFSENDVFYSKKVEKKEYKNIFKNNYIISYGSVIKKKLFFKILKDNDYGNWDKETPFGFEKNSEQIKWLPLRIAYLKKQIFISIDDDHDIPGSSLHSKGEYKKIKKNKRDKNASHLRKYLKIGKQYHLKNKIHMSIKILKYFVSSIKINLSFNELLKLISYSRDLNQKHISVLGKILNCKYFEFIIFSINNDLNFLKKINTKKKFKIISNNIFTEKKNNFINLDPIKFFDTKDYNKKFFSKGYLIRTSKIKKIDKKIMIIIDAQIFKVLSKKTKKELKPNIFLIY